MFVSAVCFPFETKRGKTTVYVSSENFTIHPTQVSELLNIEYAS